MAFWVYILRCLDQRYCPGHSDAIDGRIAQHNAGGTGGCTSTRLPARRGFCELLATGVGALEKEWRIKGWSRANKAVLMREDSEEVSRLARNTLKKIEGQAVHGSTGSPRTGNDESDHAN